MLSINRRWVSCRMKHALYASPSEYAERLRGVGSLQTVNSRLPAVIHILTEYTLFLSHGQST